MRFVGGVLVLPVTSLDPATGRAPRVVALQEDIVFPAVTAIAR